MNQAYVYRGAHYRDAEPLRAWHARALPEEVLEPDLPIIDSHQHMWDHPQRGPYFFHAFLEDLAAGGHNIVQTVFMECEAMYRATGPKPMRPVGEVEFVRGMRAMSASGRYGSTRICTAMVGFVDLTLGARVREVLAAEIEAGDGLLRGVRCCLPWDKHDEIVKYIARHIEPSQLADKTFRDGLAQLAPLNLTFDIWVFHTQLPDVVALARDFPDTTIILNHVGGALGVGPYAGHRDEVFGVWKAHLAELASCPNVRVKLGGLGLLHFGFPFHLRDRPPTSAELADAWRPYVETCVLLFGADRCMFESNFPPDKQSCSYRTLWNAFKRVTAGVAAAEKAALFGGTATATYRLT